MSTKATDNQGVTPPHRRNMGLGVSYDAPANQTQSEWAGHCPSCYRPRNWPPTNKALDLDEIFKDWVFTSKTAQVVVNEKPAFAIFKDDMPRFKAAINQLIANQVAAARDEYPWKKIQRHLVTTIEITDLDTDPTGATKIRQQVYCLPKNWVDKGALKTGGKDSD